MRFHAPVLALALAATAGPAAAATEQYQLDEGHTFITFEVSHIGYAWIPGTFNDFSGSFTYDPETRSNSSAAFTIKTASIDTEHAKRDKHMRSDEFFNVSKYPEATFKSTSYRPTGKNSAVMSGDLTIKGTTRKVEFKVQELAAREDPWGNFRRGFTASTTIDMRDFSIDEYGLPEVSQKVDLRIAVEGLRQ
ncbi:MAG: YceI family protein [Halofilum sp. (in: g-proteobacteria)]|nr:YceI family protein [Halofilum sp. (in: g-proteobacteria)]